MDAAILVRADVPDTRTGYNLTRGRLFRLVGDCVLTINVAVLLAVIIVIRLRRRTQARSRNDEKLTVLIVLVFGILVAPTEFGQGVLDMVGQLASGINDASR